jgi:tryptophan halogenase
MEPDRRIRRIAIVGGGYAAWTAAVMLGKKLGGQCSIHVVESPEPAYPGLAEATQPTILELLKYLGVDQNDFVDKTQSTYSFGSRYIDWAAEGQAFWHPFGGLGALIERRPFYHYWHKARALGLTPRLEACSQEVMMAAANRFIFPTNQLGIATHLRYALHVDVYVMARYLRTIAERAGVIRLERKVVSATRREDGFLDELQFEDGGKLRADLYIDCTGSRAQLIGEMLESPYESWQQWLPCDRMVHAPGPLEEMRPPYVRVAARPLGWRRLMPLQQVLSNSLVYSSAHQTDEAAVQELLTGMGAAPFAEPRRQEFVQGCRRKSWDKNVIALGNASGFLEPLAATDQHLTTNALFNLLDHFPDKQFDPANIASYNALNADEFERNRDFLILHYNLSRRADTPFWQQAGKGELPAAVEQRISLYRATGRVIMQRPEVFSDLDWFWIFEGCGVVPRDYDPLVDSVDFEQVKRLMTGFIQKVAADTAAAPSHDSFFAQANSKLARKPPVAQTAG